MRAALTCDDAPTIIDGEHGLERDAARLDAVADTLREHGVRHCVAFVIGATAKGEEARLERWLDAGFELGNHTFDHPHASDLDAASFLENVKRCDELLQEVGAFEDGRPRYFRFPFLDRGRPETRLAVRDGLRDLGYTGAPASVDFLDHLYEAPLREALASGSAARVEKVESRYLRAAVRSLERVDEATRTRAAGLIQVPLFHVGQITPRVLGDLLECLAAKRLDWCNLGEALRHDWYQSYERDLEQTGVADAPVRARSPLERVRRRLARLSLDCGLFDQGRAGPLWPYL